MRTLRQIRKSKQHLGKDVRRLSSGRERFYHICRRENVSWISLELRRQGIIMRFGLSISDCALLCTADGTEKL